MVIVTFRGEIRINQKVKLLSYEEFWFIVCNNDRDTCRLFL
jgi:hypothetical protein